MSDVRIEPIRSHQRRRRRGQLSPQLAQISGDNRMGIDSQVPRFGCVPRRSYARQFLLNAVVRELPLNVAE
jgi:hypothetical protein